LSRRYRPSRRALVLSGINLGRWGRDAGRPQGMRLAGLLKRLWPRPIRGSGSVRSSRWTGATNCSA
jgi:hypothetical protein